MAFKQSAVCTSTVSEVPARQERSLLTCIRYKTLAVRAFSRRAQLARYPATSLMHAVDVLPPVYAILQPGLLSIDSSAEESSQHLSRLRPVVGRGRGERGMICFEKQQSGFYGLYELSFAVPLLDVHLTIVLTGAVHLRTSQETPKSSELSFLQV